MALVLKDRVKETSATAGTGALTLGGTSTGYQAFSVIGNGNTTYYTIYDSTTGAWEVGTGTYTSSTNSLSRDSVFSSSNGGNLVDFAANTKDVFVAYPAEEAVTLDSAQTLSNKTLSNANLGTPTAGVLTNATGLPLTTGVTGVLPIANGGTNASTAATARTNLGAAASGANSDITSMSGITGGISTPDYIDFDTTAGATPAVGRLYWDGGTTLAVGMTANVNAPVNESLFIYVKASAAITKGQVIVQDGAVGASGVLKAKPSPMSLTDAQTILGIAAENIALNAFGLIQTHGYLSGLNTTGSSVGETWADGDQLYYNPAYAGGLTKVKPTAPYIKLPMGEVVNAGSGGSGSLIILLGASSQLGGTNSNVQFGTLNNNDLITYDSTLQYWKNVAPSTVTVGNVSGTVAVANGGTGLTTTPTNGQIDIGNGTGFTRTTLTAGSGVSISNGAGSVTISATGTGGTVTSVGGTGTVNGITLSGTVTTSGNLTLGGALSGVSLTTQVTGTLPIANGGTGQTTQQAALNALAGATTSAYYLRGNGTNVSMSALSATDLTGTVAVATGGTGVSTTPTNGQLLIGNGSGYTLANVTAGSGISVTNSAGGITIAATGGGSTVAISNDTSTSTNVYPAFVNATSGTTATVYTGNAKLLYKPSTGELQSTAVVASNGIFVNANSSTSNYTIAAGTNGMTVGPYTISPSTAITVAAGQRWVML